MKSLFTIFAISCIALIIWWTQSLEDKAEALPRESDPHFIDSFMRDFMLTAMDDTGQPSYSLQASHMKHFNDNDHSILTEPVFRFLPSQTQWTISAQYGEVNNAHSMITLQKNVVMQQQGATNPIQITTSQLTIDTSQQKAQSEQKVHIKHGKLKLESNGMIFDHQGEQLELLSNVTGHYVQLN